MKTKEQRMEWVETKVAGISWGNTVGRVRKGRQINTFKIIVR